MMKHKKKVKKIAIALAVTLIGLLLFKAIPMMIWGNDILYDASAHMALAILALYTLWQFLDHNPKWKIPYFLFSMAVLVIISLQRILTNNHNDVGLLLGLIIGATAIIASDWKYYQKRIRL